MNVAPGKFRIAIDLDGTLCPTKTKGQSYSDVVPYPDGVVFVQKLKREGHTIIIFTARHQSSYSMNMGKIIANIDYLHNWLKKWDIPYDEICFKPLADFYIDDRAIHHKTWTTTSEFFETECKNTLPLSLQLKT